MQYAIVVKEERYKVELPPQYENDSSLAAEYAENQVATDSLTPENTKIETEEIV